MLNALSLRDIFEQLEPLELKGIGLLRGQPHLINCALISNYTRRRPGVYDDITPSPTLTPSS
jgi:hypothetical protein